MSNVAYLWDPISLAHDTGPHVETIDRAERLRPERVRPRLSGVAFPGIQTHDAVEAILRVHRREYHDWVRTFCNGGGGYLDASDTVVCLRSYDAAIGSVNAGLTAVDLVMKGDVKRVFSAMRPPGHHAIADQAMGFCIFGNIAIAAKYAQMTYGFERVAIVDFDVHHGNGTQALLYDDPSVLCISMHQMPLWPMTGYSTERGEGAGEGATLNVPVRPGTAESAQLRTFSDVVIPAVNAFKPELLFIAAGFDAHRDDPLAELNLTEAGFAQMTRELRQIADDYCDGRIVSLLEGGYNLDALENSVVAHIQELDV
ncbi:MAG TPA: histone deacetylase [Phycisphaerae bacterium]|nr:histone deacetylase [Phycisphaerae bacterium]HRW54018.1 histone deacetylase [Phycisphaerae bacterium]